MSVLALSIIPYSYADWEAERHADECQVIADRLTKYDVVPRAELCHYENFCKDVQVTVSSSGGVLEDDYITQKFLDTNPLISLEIPKVDHRTHFFHFFTWYLYHDHDSYPQLSVSFDMCGNITQYYYKHGENELFDARYPTVDTQEKIANFEDDRYEIIKAILGRHPPPDIQVSEFGKPLDETNCNGKDHELYVRNGDSLICASPQAHAMMVERGLDVRHPPPDETNCNGKDHELYVRNGDSLICTSPQTYAMMVERGLDVRPA